MQVNGPMSLLKIDHNYIHKNYQDIKNVNTEIDYH